MSLSGPNRSRIVMPVVVLLAALAATVTDGILFVRNDALGPYAGSCTLLVLGLICIRHGLDMRAYTSLARDLEQRVEERTGAVMASQRRLSSLLAHSSDVVLVVDIDGRITFVSDSITEIFHLSPTTLLGAPVTVLVQPEEVPGLHEDVAQAISRPKSTQLISFHIRTGDGRLRLTETLVTSLVDDPDVAGLVLNTRDITERRELEEQLRHQAFHDGLTHLANRALFREHVAHGLAVAGRNETSVAVLFCDLDGFKSVNDTLGHSAGDRLLQDMARRLVETVREVDTVARLGGDEFAVLLENIRDENEVDVIARRIIEAVKQPFEIDARSLQIRASVGIAMGDPLQGDHITVEELLRNADLAMYRAKAQRGGCFAWFEKGMHSSLVARVREEEDLRHALDEDQLHLHYQPIVNLKTGQLVGTEALLRWQHPTRGMIAPNDFIALAEETDLIVPIGTWVLRESTRQLAQWLSDYPEHPMTIAVNVSGRQLLVGDIAAVIADALNDSGLSPAQLCIELTESLLLDSTGGTTQLLQDIRESGVRIAIDDFGTGYSSLSYLSRFPVDLLKVDRSFVDPLHDSTQESVLARTIVQLGQSLSLSTVAEGIESSEQLAALQAMGCENGQGYYFSKAVPASEISRLIGKRFTINPQPPQPLKIWGQQALIAQGMPTVLVN